MRLLADIIGFEWDDGNRNKNLMRHKVTTAECEEAFGDQRRAVRVDATHSKTEARHYLVGQTNSGRLLYISFTIRSSLIRVISARDINRKERVLYEK